MMLAGVLYMYKKQMYNDLSAALIAILLSAGLFVKISTQLWFGQAATDMMKYSLHY